MSVTGLMVVNLFEDRKLENKFGTLNSRIMPKVGYKFRYINKVYEITDMVIDLEKYSADVLVKEL